jgi:4-oxalocrotonate tautomerase
MPEVFVYMFEGRNIDQKRRLVQGVTAAVSEALDVSAETVTIQLVEGPKEHRARGGRLISDLHNDAAKGQS